MRKSRFSEEQIVGVLKEAEAGVPLEDLCRRLGVSAAKRLRGEEEKNRELKHVVAELTLDNRALKAVLSKKW